MQTWVQLCTPYGGRGLTTHWDPRQPAPLPPHCRYGWMASDDCTVVLVCNGMNF